MGLEFLNWQDAMYLRPKNIDSFSITYAEAIMNVIVPVISNTYDKFRDRSLFSIADHSGLKRVVSKAVEKRKQQIQIYD